MVELISEAMTEAIMEGVFQEGDQLVELEMQKQFQVSRTPIREAFRMLEKEGLVEVIPRRGTFIKNISARDIKEHFPVRSVLEGLAAKQAYVRMGPDELRSMELALRKMKAASERKDTKNYWKQHILFHEIFIGACGNQLLINLLKTMRMQIMWYRLSYQYYKEDFKRSFQKHQTIFGYFKSKNTEPDRLEAFVRDHIDEAVDKFLSYLDEQKNTQTGDRKG